MSEKTKNFSGDIFKTFSHMTKMNLRNTNDEILLKEIEDITNRITLEVKDDAPDVFMSERVSMYDLREDVPAADGCDWLEGANETEEGFVCVSNIVEGKGI